MTTKRTNGAIVYDPERREALRNPYTDGQSRKWCPQHLRDFKPDNNVDIFSPQGARLELHTIASGAPVFSVENKPEDNVNFDDTKTIGKALEDGKKILISLDPEVIFRDEFISHYRPIVGAYRCLSFPDWLEINRANHIRIPVEENRLSIENTPVTFFNQIDQAINAVRMNGKDPDERVSFIFKNAVMPYGSFIYADDRKWGEKFKAMYDQMSTGQGWTAVSDSRVFGLPCAFKFVPAKNVSQSAILGGNLWARPFAFAGEKRYTANLSISRSKTNEAALERLSTYIHDNPSRGLDVIAVPSIQREPHGKDLALTFMIYSVRDAVRSHVLSQKEWEKNRGHPGQGKLALELGA